MNDPAPAFYALPSGGARDYVTLLHLPYTAWHLSYAIVGGCLAATVDWWVLGLTVLAFALAMGVGAHALDELNGRPLETRIPSKVLVALAIGSVAAAAAIGIVVAVERTLWRDLIPLLRVRRDTGVRVAALGPLAVEGVSLERVRVIRGGVDVTLLVEPSGRVHSMSFSDRKNDGEFGDIAIVYGDFKPVEGVLVPFSETATFNGERPFGVWL